MKHLELSRTLVLSALLLGSAALAQAETTPPQPVDLGATANFLLLSGAGIQNLSSAGLVINGNIGTSPASGSTITGITKAMVTGLIYTVDAGGPAGSTIDPTYLTMAKGDMTTAYNDAFGRVLARVTQGPELGGLTLAPGLYWSATGFTVSTGDLTLDAGGNANGVWIFQAGTAGSPTDVQVLTTRNITMANGGKAANVFWSCRTGILGTSTSFRGNILADQSITNAGNGIFEGRQLAFTGSVTLNGVANPSMGWPTGFSPTNPGVPTNATYIYPSPTVGKLAHIAYTLSSPGTVTIHIYNEAGRLVDTITEPRGTGWQAFSVSVEDFAPGAYFYLLTAKYDNGTKSSQPSRKFVVLH